MRDAVSARVTPARRDLVLAAGVAIVVGAASFSAAVLLDPRFLDPATGNDVWFEGDLGRIADEMTHRWAAHSRTPVHPLFSLVTVCLTYFLRAAGASSFGAVAGVVAVSAAAWAVACLALYRSLGVSRGDALLLVALTVCSASGMFWLTVPETAALGSASVIAALAVGARASRCVLRERWFITASAASLAITVTNWMAGLVVAGVSLPWRRALQVSVNGFAVVVALWTVQRVVVPHAAFFIGSSNEERYLLRPEAVSPATALGVVAVDGMVMPRIGRYVKPARGPIMSVQRSGWRTQTLLWKLGAAVWMALLIAGTSALARRWSQAREYWPLVLVLAFELALYAVYGTESFLYTLNVVPLLVGMVAGGLMGAARRLVRVSIVALLTVVLVNNATRFGEARAYFTPAVAERIASMLAPTSVPSSAAFLYGLVDER